MESVTQAKFLKAYRNTLHVFMYELDDEWHVSHVDRLIRSKDIV